MSQKSRKNNTIIIDNYALNEKQNSKKNLNFHIIIIIIQVEIKKVSIIVY